MMYLIGEILLCLLVAALLGLAVGWILKTWLVGDVEAGWRTRLGEAEGRMRLMEEDSSARLARLTDDLEVRNVKLTRLSADLETAKAHFEELNGEHAGLTDRFRALEAEREQLNARVEALDAELGGSAAKAAELDAECVTLRKAAAELEARLSEREAAAAGLERELSEREAELARLEKKLADRDAAAAAQAKSQADLEGRLAARDARVGELEQELAAARATFEARSTEIDNGWQSRWDEQAGRLAVLEAASSSSKGELEGAQRARRDLETQLADCRRGREELRTCVDSLQAEVEHERAESAGLRTKLAALGQEPSSARRRPAALPTAAVPPARRDDLKKIFGIGPVLERLLNQHGVYRFADIAAWTADDIERFSGYLDVFAGRIERDGWVRGAQLEHERKYGVSGG